MSKNNKIIDPTNEAYPCRIYPNKFQEEIFNDSFKLNRDCYNFLLNRENENNNLATLEFIKIKFPNDIISYEKLDEKNKRKSYLINNIKFDFKTIDNSELKQFVNKYKKDNNLFFSEKGNKEKNIKSAYKTFTENYKEEVNPNVPRSLLNYSIESFKNALDKCYKKQGGFPKFKSYMNSNQSFSDQVKRGIKQLNIRNKKKNKIHLIDLPKLKNLEIIIHNHNIFNDNLKIKKYTVSKNCHNQYFISLTVHNPNKIIVPTKAEINYDSSIGIDANIGHLNFSNGDEIKMTKLMQHHNNNLKILNKKLSLKKGSKKGEIKSNSYIRLHKQYNKIYSKISNIRNYRNHMIANSLLNNNDYNTIILEDLSVKKMTERTKNQTDHSKQNTKKKRSMRRNILDMGWYDLYSKLQTKAKKTTKNVFKVNPAYTSKTCSNCNHINHNLKLSDREWTCPNCGKYLNRDINASINIKNSFFNNLEK